MKINEIIFLTIKLIITILIIIVFRIYYIIILIKSILALIVKNQIEGDVPDRFGAVAQYVARLMVTQLDDVLLGRQVEVTLKLSFKFPD